MYSLLHLNYFIYLYFMINVLYSVLHLYCFIYLSYCMIYVQCTTLILFYLYLLLYDLCTVCCTCIALTISAAKVWSLYSVLHLYCFISLCYCMIYVQCTAPVVFYLSLLLYDLCTVYCTCIASAISAIVWSMYSVLHLYCFSYVCYCMIYVQCTAPVLL